nr:MAG TPA: hypothetical protein [Caudoviricetes sp.]
MGLRCKSRSWTAKIRGGRKPLWARPLKGG